MNWRNPFLTGYLALTVGGAALFGYLAFSAYSHYTEVSDTYDSQVQRLQKLQNRRPFPSDENNASMRALSAEYRSEYERLVQAFTRLQRPLETITPQTFQDRLRDYVSAVDVAARKNGVTIAENFYLGFDQYRNALPSSEAAPALARELDAIRLVVDSLIDNKVREIKGIKRDLLTEESPRPAATPAPRPGAPAAAKTPAPSATSPISRSAFTIVFVADQGRFRQTLNDIVRAPQFFVIRSLNVQNEKLEGPSRKVETTGDAAGAAPGAAPSGGDPLAALLAAPAAGAATGESSATPSMRLLVGRELLTVGARIEILNFIPPTAASR